VCVRVIDVLSCVFVSACVGPHACDMRVLLCARLRPCVAGGKGGGSALVCKVAFFPSLFEIGALSARAFPGRAHTKVFFVVSCLCARAFPPPSRPHPSTRAFTLTRSHARTTLASSLLPQVWLLVSANVGEGGWPWRPRRTILSPNSLLTSLRSVLLSPLSLPPPFLLTHLPLPLPLLSQRAQEADKQSSRGRKKSARPSWIPTCENSPHTLSTHSLRALAEAHTHPAQLQ
jgi:hypothetical protein